MILLLALSKQVITFSKNILQLEFLLEVETRSMMIAAGLWRS